MAIVTGSVKNKEGNLVPNIRVKVYREDTWEIIGEGITGDGITPFTEGDIYYNDVELLLDFEGENNSTNIIDKSKNNIIINNFNNTQLKTDVKSTGNSSCYFNGTNNYLTAENHNLCINNCAFTLDIKFYIIQISTYAHILDTRLSDGDNFTLGVQSDKKVYLYSGNSMRIQDGLVNLNTWQDLSLTMDNNKNITIFLNGSKLLTVWNKGTIVFNNPLFLIGRYFASVQWLLNGYIDQYRFTKNIVRYSNNYTPDNKAYPTKMASFGGDLGTYNITTKDYVGKISIIAIADENITGKNHLIERRILT